MKTKAEIAAGIGGWLAKQPTGPGAPFRFLQEDEPSLKTDFDSLSSADQEDVFRAIDLMGQMSPAVHDLKGARL